MRWFCTSLPLPRYKEPNNIIKAPIFAEYFLSSLHKDKKDPLGYKLALLKFNFPNI